MVSTMTVEINTDTRLYAVVFSANGECLVSGGKSGVQVWKLQDGKEMTTMQTSDAVLCLAVSQDGSKIAAGTDAGDVLVWNGAATYQPVFTFKHKEDGHPIHGVDFSPDSTRLVSASDNKTATVWDIATSKRVLLLQHDYSVTATKYSPQGDRIATVGYFNSKVRVYDSNDGSPPLKIEPKPFAWHNKGLVWLNDQHLLVVSTDNLVKQLDASTGSTVVEWAVPRAYSSYGSCISLPRHGKFLAYSTEHTVTFWDVLTHAQLSPVLEHPQGITSITISPDDRFLAIGGFNGKITIESLKHINAIIHEEDERLCAPADLPGSNPEPAFELSRLLGIADSMLLSPVHPTLQESDFQVNNAALDLWKQDRLTETEAGLTANIATSRNPTHHAFVARALVRARLQEWDTALEDAEKSIEIQPSVIGYIAKSMVHVCKGEKDKGYRTCDMAFARTQSSHATFLLLIKAIIVFMAGEHIDAISRVDDLIRTADSNTICYVIQAYMYLLIGNSRMKCSDCNGAIESYEHAQARTRNCAESQLLLLISLLFGWQFDNIGMMIQQHLCDALYEAGRIKEAVEYFHQMTSEGRGLGGTNLRGQHIEWADDFRDRCFQKLAHLGDSAANDQRYDEAITHYTAALSLDLPTPQEILIKRAEVFLAVGSWEHALNDGNRAIALDPSSPRGHEVKHAALHEVGEYDEAVNAFEAMLSRMAQSPDPDVRQRADQYIHPSTTRVEIRKIVEQRIRHLPRVLIQTSTGRLHDKAQQASSFESLSIFNQLVSSTTTRIDYVRMKHIVREFFRYVMFSHKWEDNEPLFSDVMQTVVYGLEKSPTHDKLQRFCKIAQDSGFNWAWSDTCCINKSDHFVLQEALVAMFKWYQNAALVIVFLRGVHSWSELGALIQSLWNSRAWTLQEYIAAKIVHFYTEDWTLYLNLNIQNHKESPQVISEMEQATGVSAKQLMSLRPGLTNIREKLRLASPRQTTMVEDAAYSLLGIFSVTGLPAIYGEGEGSLGRLLAHVLAGSGDVSVLAWTGDSGPFNSCLPAHNTVFDGPATSHLPSPIPDADLENLITNLSFELDIALNLYDRLSELSAPWFAASRMKLPCIAFQLPSLSSFRTRSSRVYRAETFAFGMVKIKTRHDLSGMHPLYLVHPWLSTLLEHEGTSGGIAREVVAPPVSPDMEDQEFFGEDIDDDEEIPEDEIRHSSLISRPPSCSHHVPVVQMDKETRARRLVARLRQPFGALLLTRTSTGGRTVDYTRVAADASIMVQFSENISLVDILDNVRTLDVL